MSRDHPRCCWVQGLLRESQQASERLQKEYNALSEKVWPLKGGWQEAAGAAGLAADLCCPAVCRCNWFNPPALLRSSICCFLPHPAHRTGQVGRLHHTLEEHVHANTQLLADNSQRQVRADEAAGISIA